MLLRMQKKSILSLQMIWFIYCNKIYKICIFVLISTILKRLKNASDWLLGLIGEYGVGEFVYENLNGPLAE